MTEKDTDTQNQELTLSQLLQLFAVYDSHKFEAFLIDIGRCIRNSQKRVFSPQKVVDFYKEPLTAQAQEGARIRNEELLNTFFEDWPLLKSFRKELSVYSELKEGFAEVFGSHENYPLYEEFINHDRNGFKMAIRKAEGQRKQYLGKQAGTHGEIVKTALRSAPFGSKEVAAKTLYDLAQCHIGLGFYGTAITRSAFDAVYQSHAYMVEQFDHPTLQGS